MKQRKFRAWDYQNKIMTDKIAIAGNGFVTTWIDGDALRGPLLQSVDWYVMQCTGLKDKNGKEIYEGDIVKYWYSRDTTGKDICSFAQAVEWTQEGDMYGFGVLSDMNPEVIGNIYENPELLPTMIEEEKSK